MRATYLAALLPSFFVKYFAQSEIYAFNFDRLFYNEGINGLLRNQQIDYYIAIEIASNGRDMYNLGGLLQTRP
jgi:hypothetical protein